MITTGAWNKGLTKGLQRDYLKSYQISPLEFGKFIHEKYALGFQVSREMVEDDLYGNIMKKVTKKFKLKVQTLHRVYVTEMGSGVELDGNIIRLLGTTTYDVAQGKDLVKAINMLLKLSKPKKVVKRKRRIKK